MELDIVAEKDHELVVVEVKTRANGSYREPQEAVDWLKIRRIVIATDAYIKHFGWDKPVRFDIITVVGQNGDFQIEHIENAFYPPLF